jgi:hypothetical protein
MKYEITIKIITDRRNIYVFKTELKNESGKSDLGSNSSEH